MATFKLQIVDKDHNDRNFQQEDTSIMGDIYTMGIYAEIEFKVPEEFIQTGTRKSSNTPIVDAKLTLTNPKRMDLTKTGTSHSKTFNARTFAELAVELNSFIKQNCPANLEDHALIMEGKSTCGLRCQLEIEYGQGFASIMTVEQCQVQPRQQPEQQVVQIKKQTSAMARNHTQPFDDGFGPAPIFN